MLIGLDIRDVVLIEALDLSVGPGLTVLTGETGGGKSIILDALGLGLGARAGPGLLRQGRPQASAAVIFAPAADHPLWAYLEEKGFSFERDEDLVLRRQLAADGRSRAFVNDQPASVGVLRDLGALLIEVHGQHETVGLLDARTHRPLLDAFGGLGSGAADVMSAWTAWKSAREQADALRQKSGQAAAEIEELTLRLAELDRLDPREGEETALAEERALLGGAEKTLADIAAARAAYLEAAGRLSAARRAAGERLAQTVQAELAPLKLDKARFQTTVEVLTEAQAGPAGMDRVEFQVATNPGAPFGGLGDIASGGELARFALALKAALAGRGDGPSPVMIFDEVDQGVGGAVADAVGARLKRLAQDGQVLVVTHSPQVAARADAHWKVAKEATGGADGLRTVVQVLDARAREEEIARMLAGAEITDAARAAARALMHA